MIAGAPPFDASAYVDAVDISLRLVPRNRAFLVAAVAHYVARPDLSAEDAELVDAAQALIDRCRNA